MRTRILDRSEARPMHLVVVAGSLVMTRSAGPRGGLNAGKCIANYVRCLVKLPFRKRKGVRVPLQVLGVLRNG